MLTAIILAAGDSSRMGRPKALLEYRGRFFIENVCAALRLAGIEERVAVLGRDAAAITSAWKPAGEKVVVNPEPDLGQISSLRAGLLAADPGAEAFMVCLADQPTVAPGTYRELIAFWVLHKDAIVIPRCKRDMAQEQSQVTGHNPLEVPSQMASGPQTARSQNQSPVTGHKSQVTTPDSADSPLATNHSPLSPGHSPLSFKRGHPIIIPAIYRNLCFEGPLEAGLHWVIHHPSVKIFDFTVEDAGIIRDFDTPQDYEKPVNGNL
jgi:CTP:molybdopterin cytidylyltransferase MocA